ncbi:MAG: MATE family efflux transporter [Clostridia bacterium]|nr:MATE family efflux transporter [Clostridia bacterium]
MMKKNIDMTRGSVTKSILLFALPIFLGNIFQQAYNLADTAIAGHFLGDDALSAIGASSSLFSFLMYFIGGLNGGFSLIIARFFGEKDDEKLKNSIAATVVMNVVLSVVAVLLSFVLLKPMLVLLKTPDEIMADAFSYIFTVYLGAGVMACYNAQANLLRALGNSVTPIVFLVVSSVFNIGLDVLFIKGFGMGVKGAALATVVSQFISCVLCQISIVKSYKKYKTSKENYVFNSALYKEMFSAGITMAMMNCIFAIGSLILQGAINGLGKAVIAGHLAARKIVELFMQPMITVSTACSTFVSQNFGAGKTDRIKKAVTSSIVSELVMSGVFIVVVYAFCTQMINFVTSTQNAEIVNTAKTYLYINMPFFPALGVLYVMRTAIQGIGKRIAPLVSSSIELLSKVVAAFFIAKPFGYKGIACAEPISWLLCAIFITTTFVSAFKKISDKRKS